jgi:hypothetical protein
MLNAASIPDLHLPLHSGRHRLFGENAHGQNAWLLFKSYFQFLFVEC